MDGLRVPIVIGVLGYFSIAVLQDVAFACKYYGSAGAETATIL